MFLRPRVAAILLTAVASLTSVGAVACGVLHCVPPSEVATEAETHSCHSTASSGAPESESNGHEPSGGGGGACCIALPGQIEATASALLSAPLSGPAILLPAPSDASVRRFVLVGAVRFSERPPGPSSPRPLPLRV